MKLSMHIISEWLKSYHPIEHIQSGKRNIRNVRLFSDDHSITSYTVYLDLFHNDKIICSHGSDFIILTTTDLNEVFNRLLDAFDFYNTWEHMMLDMIYEGCSLQALLQQGYQIIRNYLVVADSSFLIREGCGTDEEIKANKEYFEAFQRKLLPVEVLNKFNEDPRLRMTRIKPYLLDIPSMHKRDIVANIIVNGIHYGWVICMRSDNTYTQMTFDLIDEFAKHVSLWYRIHQKDEPFMDRSSVILELMNDPSSNQASIQHRLEAFNWYQYDEKIIYVMKPGLRPKSSESVVRKHSEHIFFGSFAVEYEGHILLVINSKLCKPNSEELLPALLESSGYVAGKSATFTDILDIRKYYDIAKIAADYADDTHRLRSFWDAILPYMKQLINDHSPISLIHPAISILSDYDLGHATSLLDTLRVFIENKCSYTKTAGALFIHRSTLLYRLEKIQQLTGLDLENYSTLLHLQLSYMLL